MTVRGKSSKKHSEDHLHAIRQKASALPRERKVDVDLRKAAQAKLEDMAKRPMSPRSLVELEQMTRILRELLVLGHDPRALHRGRHLGPGSSIVDASQMTDSFYDGDMVGGGGVASAAPWMNGNVLAPAPPAENFGATLMRELLALKGATKARDRPSAEGMIDAIALAREKGLTDLADKLEMQLLGDATPSGKPGASAKPDAARPVRAKSLGKGPLKARGDAP